MATLLESAALATHEMFRQRVTVSMLKAAVAVASEATTDDTRRDSLRSGLATNVLSDPELYAKRFSWAVVTNATIANAGLLAPDGDIEYVVTGVWDALAGV